MSDYFVRLKNSVETAPAHLLEIGANLFTGEKDFGKAFSNVTTLELDLLRLSAAVFAADRATERGVCENVQRLISLSVPVSNFQRLAPQIPNIQSALRRLSDDWWNITLRQQDMNAEPALSFPKVDGSTLLFSGGLDSLAAAIEFGKAGKPLDLVSHTTKNAVTSSVQKKLVALLKKNGYSLSHRQFFVSSRNAAPGKFEHSIENSQRTRSFLFLIIGALCARRTGNSKLVMLAENGQLAIHLPLTTGRLGALSTHTAHPDFVSDMELILGKLLNYKIKIINPYLYKTKAETISTVMSKLPAGVAVSTSCWRNTKLKGKATHCGSCIPCYIRRIAVETHCKDPTAYSEDVWSTNIAALGEEDNGRRNLLDLAEFIRRFESDPAADLMHEYPELYSANIVAADAIDMYRRFSLEARKVLSKYPHVSPFLS